jgi:DNA relaxase NicK
MDSAGFHPLEAEGGRVRFYARNRVLTDPKGHQLLAIKSGGSNPHPHVECYGRAAPVLARYLREGVSHRPTRIDHAVDLRAPSLFDQLHQSALAICKQHGLRGAPAGDWVTSDAGRTFYLGSRKSQVSVRIYEKGLKYAHDLGLPVTDELREWVRIELEFHPQTEAAKSLAPSIEGPQLWGSTGWTDQLAREVLSMATEPVSIRERRESNRERALRFMASQYGSHLKALLADCNGDLAEFGRAIADLAGLIDQDVQEAA